MENILHMEFGCAFLNTEEDSDLCICLSISNQAEYIALALYQAVQQLGAMMAEMQARQATLRMTSIVWRGGSVLSA